MKWRSEYPAELSFLSRNGWTLTTPGSGNMIPASWSGIVKVSMWWRWSAKLDTHSHRVPSRDWKFRQQRMFRALQGVQLLLAGWSRIPKESSENHANIPNYREHLRSAVLTSWLTRPEKTWKTRTQHTWPERNVSYNPKVKKLIKTAFWLTTFRQDTICFQSCSKVLCTIHHISTPILLRNRSGIGVWSDHRPSYCY